MLPKLHVSIHQLQKSVFLPEKPIFFQFRFLNWIPHLIEPWKHHKKSSICKYLFLTFFPLPWRIAHLWKAHPCRKVTSLKANSHLFSISNYEALHEYSITLLLTFLKSTTLPESNIVESKCVVQFMKHDISKKCLLLRFL